MIIFFEFIAAIFEPIILFIGAIFAYFLGNAAYNAINSLLYSFDTPCIEIITLILAVISPIGYLFGARHKKFFTKRSGEHNFMVFISSFMFGVIVTFLPISFSYTMNGVQSSCPSQITLVDQFVQGISTGVITAIVAYLSLDLGVLYANTIGVQLKKLNRHKKK